MNRSIFTWDDDKKISNHRKHGISFEDAQTVFFDENAIEFDDPDHSINEERFILLGLNQSLKVLVVCHCYRNDVKFELSQQEKRLKRSKLFISGGCHEKRI